MEHLVGWVRNSYTSIAMVDYPYPASFLADLPAYPVNAACDIILKADNILSGLANSAGMFIIIIHTYMYVQFVIGNDIFMILPF